MKKQKTPNIFSSCTGDTYSAVPQLSAEKLWEDLFSHREGDGLLYKIPDSCSAFQEVFTLYHLFVCV